MSAALRLRVWLLLGSVLVRFAFQRLQLFNIFSIGQRLTARIREDLFSHSLALSLRFHDGMPVGKLLTRLTSDVDALAEVFASGAVGVIGDLVSLIVIATTMLLFDWRLGLFLLATQLPVTAVVLWFRVATARPTTGFAKNSPSSTLIFRKTSRVLRWFRCSDASRSTALVLLALERPIAARSTEQFSSTAVFRLP